MKNLILILSLFIWNLSVDGQISLINSVPVKNWIELDCYGTTVSNYTGVAISGGGRAVTYTTISPEDHPGILKIQTVGANTGYTYYLNNSGYNDGEEIRATLYILDTVNTNIDIGTTNSITASTPTNGVYFRIVGAVCEGVVMISSAARVTSTSFGPNDNTWYTFHVLVGDTCRFTVTTDNGAIVFSSTALGIPTAVEQSYVGIKVIDTNAGSADVVYLDRVAFRKSIPISRGNH
jgi:hypothetical protein